MNIVTQLTQFRGRDVINTTDLAVHCSAESVEFSWVELCRYRHPSVATQLNLTRRRVELCRRSVYSDATQLDVELSCVAINTPLVVQISVLYLFFFLQKLDEFEV